jgi:hypothetical protein
LVQVSVFVSVFITASKIFLFKLFLQQDTKKVLETTGVCRESTDLTYGPLKKYSCGDPIPFRE